jgi:hypothetical protein
MTNEFTLHTEVTEKEEESIPTDMSDIIKVCKEYALLGMNIQSQIDNLLEFGVERSISKSLVKKESLPFIKEFLKSITENVYFGDAVDQADEVIVLIDRYLNKNKVNILNN